MTGDITRLLQQVRAGNPEAQSKLLPLVYGELRRIAAYHMRGERPGHTLQPTALVHEAYMRLVAQDTDWHDRAHFFAIAAQSMRRVLVDYARRRKSTKRGGTWKRLEMEEVIALNDVQLDDIVEIDRALERLAIWDPRQCRVVEMRFFAGLDEEEIAAVEGISTRTVKRDWKMARAWLRGQLSSQR